MNQAGPHLSQPVFIGQPGQKLFAQLFRPQGAPKLALVICPPYGYEAVLAHSRLRQLAFALADAGHAVLHLDYAGCGQSQGDNDHGNCVEPWLQSINEALDFLHLNFGSVRLGLVGLRLGVTLGAACAARRGDVDVLVAMESVVHARRHVRELRMMQSQPSEVMQGDAKLFEAAGFCMSLVTREAMEALDLCKEDALPAARVLMLSSKDAANDQAWMAHLRARHAQVEHLGMAQDPIMPVSHWSVPPLDRFEPIQSWLQAQLKALGPAPAAAPGDVDKAPAATPIADLDEWVREEALYLNTEQPMFGIISRPRQNPSGGRKRAILLINDGINRGLGPCRIWVPLARRWSAQGMVVLRLDLCGLGDSPARAGQPLDLAYSPHAVDDVTMAAKWLKEVEGADEVWGVGLCSGGHHLFHAGLHRAPMDALVMINVGSFYWESDMSTSAGFVEEWVASEMQRHRKNIFSVKQWRRIISGDITWERMGNVLRHFGRAFERKARHVLADRLHIRLRAPLERQLMAIAKGGAMQYYIFAAGERVLASLRHECAPTLVTLQASGHLSLTIIPHGDHSFTDMASRTLLLDALNDLIESRIAGRPAATTQAT